MVAASETRRGCCRSVKARSVSSTLKKAPKLVAINPAGLELLSKGPRTVRLEPALEAELDEQWSYVGSQSNPRWLWYAVDHATNSVLAEVFGGRKDAVF